MTIFNSYVSLPEGIISSFLRLQLAAIPRSRKKDSGDHGCCLRLVMLGMVGSQSENLGCPTHMEVS